MSVLGTLRSSRTLGLSLTPFSTSTLATSALTSNDYLRGDCGDTSYTCLEGIRSECTVASTSLYSAGVTDTCDHMPHRRIRRTRNGSLSGEISLYDVANILKQALVSPKSTSLQERH